MSGEEKDFPPIGFAEAAFCEPKPANALLRAFAGFF
jgi:hypothetical protein